MPSHDEKSFKSLRMIDSFRLTNQRGISFDNLRRRKNICSSGEESLSINRDKSYRQFPCAKTFWRENRFDRKVKSLLFANYATIKKRQIHNLDDSKRNDENAS